MKTAISIPDNLFKHAERTARNLKISRSHLFSVAIEEYLENHTQGQVAERLNSVYTTEENELDGNILKMQIQSINKEKW